jgi:2-oxo-4-hydroxy-4-carboxy-5-ureidoimidazoline decarboxylase
MRAPEELQMALILAHPELAGRAAQRGELTSASRGEQKGAGLNALTHEQLERLTTLNAAIPCASAFPSFWR